MCGWRMRDHRSIVRGAAMAWWIWLIIGIYAVCFVLAFFANASMGNITLGLTLLRAVLWPLWLAGFLPGVHCVDPLRCT